MSAVRLSSRNKRRRKFLGGLVAVGWLAGAGFAQQAPPQPGVRYEPTSTEVVEVMLRLAALKENDVVYDLGCGDGRIVIAAVRERAARGVCVDIDPRRIEESRENAQQAGVAKRIRFLNQDLFATDLADATVVMLFLSPTFNLELRPKLLRELRPGTRIVSHWHNMGDWTPQETVRVTSDGRERPVYLWTIPQR
jgi:SAM-dependent methyltransferase